MPRDLSLTFADSNISDLTPIAWPGVAQSKAIQTDAKIRQLDGAAPISLPHDPQARRKAISAFAKANKAAAAAGTTAFVLVLSSAEGAEAQAAAAPVAVTSVDGVEAAQVLADGTVQVTLTNGQQFTLPADSVVVNADGSILVSQAVADGLASAASTALAGGASMAGIGAGLGAGGLALAGLGGGGGGGGGDSSGGGAPAILAGRVVDGYLVGATVFRDANDNGVLDDGELNTTTDSNGDWELGLDPSAPNAKLISFGGVDASTGEAFTGVMTAPADATVITPLTMLVQALFEARAVTETPLTAEEAATQVAEALGLTGNLLELDPVEQAESGDVDAMQAAAKIAAVINVGASTATGETDEESQQAAQDASEAVAGALVDQLIGTDDTPADRNALNDETAIENALKEAGLDDAAAASGASAVKEANDLIENATDLDEIERVQEVVQGDIVEAAKTGDAATVNVAQEVAAKAPLEPVILTGDVTVGGNTGVAVINGLGKVGTEVRVTIDGQTFTTIVQAFPSSPSGPSGQELTSMLEKEEKLALEKNAYEDQGSWFIGIDADNLPQDGEFTITAEASFTTFGDERSYSDPVQGGTLTRDTTGPDVSLDPVASDNVISAAESQPENIAITGTTEALATVTVTFAGLEPKTVSADENGQFSVEFATGLLPADGDLSLSVEAADQLGNIGPSSTATIKLDTEGPSVTLDAIADDDTIASAETGAPIAVSGTTEANTSVLVTFGDQQQTVTSDETGAFSASFSAANVTDGADVSVTATATDAAGNTGAAASKSVAVDISGPGVTINSVGADGVISAAEKAAGVAISGVTEEGASVSVMIGDQTVTVDAGAGGVYSALFAETALPSDGAATVSVQATDALGNAGPAAVAAFTVDTTGPAATLDSIASDNVINKAEIENDGGVAVSGTTEAGASVLVTLGDASKTVLANDQGVFTANFVDEELPTDGTVNATATATDEYGNAGETATQSVLVDATAPGSITLQASTGDDAVLSGAEAANGVTISGVTEANASVVVTMGDASETVAADELGQYSFDFTSDDIPADGEVSYSATATDTNGNTGTTVESTFTVDTTGPAVVVTSIAEDGVISATENTAGSFVVRGTSEPGATLTISFTSPDGVSGGSSFLVPVREDGTFAHTLFTTFDSEGSIPFTLTATDQYGNEGPTLETSAIVATSGPAATLDPVSTDNLIDIVEADAQTGIGVSVTGTMIATAVSVSVDFGGVVKDAVVDLDAGTFSVDFSAEEIAGLGATTVSATATDALGNAGPAATLNVVVDTGAPVITLDPIGGNNLVTSQDTADGVTISGSTEANSSVQIIWGTFLDTVTADGDGNFSLLVSGENVPYDGQVMLSAQATDPAGNTSLNQATADITIDTTPPTVYFSSVTGDNVINASEASGDVLNFIVTAQDAVAVDVMLGDQVVSGTFDEELGFFYAALDTSLLPADGEVVFTATATDANGNTSDPVTSTVTIDTTGPSATLDTVSGDGTLTGLEIFGSVTVTGSAEGAETVAVTYRGTTYSAVTQEDGTFEAIFSANGIPDIGEETISAVATDEFGNAGPEVTTTLTIEDYTREAIITLNTATTMSSRTPDEGDTRVWLDGAIKDALSDTDPVAGDGTLTFTGSGGHIVRLDLEELPGPIPAGLVTGVTISSPTVPNAIVITGLFFPLADMEAAALASQTDDDPFAAIEAFFADYKVTINGSSGDDMLFIRAAEVVANGGGGEDVLFTELSDDSLSGDNGNDYFGITGGNNTIDGGAAKGDHVSYEWSEETVGVDLDLEQGTATHGDYTDMLSSIEDATGTLLADTIVGPNNGDDFSQIRGLGGADSLTGGTGTSDQVSYDNDARNGGEAGVTVNFQTGRATDGFGQEDTISGFEQVKGTDQADSFTMDDSIASDRWIDAGEGDDTIVSALNSATRDDNVGARLGEGSDYVLFRGGRLWLEDFNVAEDRLEMSDEMFALFPQMSIGDYSGTNDDGSAYSGLSFWHEDENGNISNIDFNGLSTDDLLNINLVNELTGQTITGTDGDDELRGTLADDVYLGSANDNEDEIIASIGNDTIDFMGLSGSNRQEIDYSNFTFDGTFTINYETNTGSVVKGPFGTDTIIDPFAAARETLDGDYQALEFIDSRGDDTATLTLDDQIWTETLWQWAGGDDHYHVHLGVGYVDVNFGRADSVDVDLSGSVKTVTTSRDHGDGVETNTVTVSSSDPTDSTDTIINFALTNGDDDFIGDELNNRITARGGDNTVDGGDGYDTLNHSWSSYGAITVDMTGTTQTVTGTFDGTAFTTEFSNIEEVRGSRNNDTMTAGEDAVRFRGRDGDDSLVGGAGNDTLEGDDGNDTYTGGAGADRFILEEGHYVITDLSQTDGDFIDGNGIFSDDDATAKATYVEINGAGNAGVRVELDSENSVTFSNLTLEQFQAILNSNGDDGSEPTDALIQGSENNDLLEGGDGDDTLIGGLGDDTYTGGLGADAFQISSGKETLTDFNPEEGDTIVGSGFFGDDVALASANFIEINGEGNVGVRIELNPDDQVTFQNLTLSQVQSALAGGGSGDSSGGAPIGNAYQYTPPSDEAGVIRLYKNLDFDDMLENGAPTSPPTVSDGGTSMEALIDYDNASYRIEFTGSGFSLGIDPNTNQPVANATQVDDVAVYDTADNSIALSMTNVQLPGSAFFGNASGASGFPTPTPSGIGFIELNGRDIVIIDNDQASDELGAYGAPTHIFTGGGDDTSYVYGAHDGVNVVVLSAGNDTVNLGDSAAPTHIIIDTTGPDASGVVHIDGFHVGNSTNIEANFEAGDLLVIERDVPFTIQGGLRWIGDQQGNNRGSLEDEVFLQSELLAAYVSQDDAGNDVYNFNDGDEGYITFHGVDQNAVVYSFAQDNGAPVLGNKIATMSNHSFTFNHTRTAEDFHEYVQYMDDLPTPPAEIA